MKGTRLMIFVLAAVVLAWVIPHAFKPAAVQGASLEAPHWGMGGVPQFKIDPNWPKIPSKWKMGFGSAVVGDTKGRVWVLTRPRRLEPGSPAAPPVMEFDQEGNFMQGWGGQSGPGYQWPSNEHGLTVDDKGFVWIEGNADGPGGNDKGLPNDNQVLKFTSDGKFVMAIGTSGMVGSNSTHVLRGATSIFVDSKNNEVYVSDGYGNSRIIVFKADTGEFLRMWGAYSHTPIDRDKRPPLPKFTLDPWGLVSTTLQQFGTYQPGTPVHDVKVSNDHLVYAADRGNKRVQVFTTDGKFLAEQFIGLDLPDLQARGLAFSNDPDQRFLYVGGTPDVWILNRMTLEILGTVQTVPKGSAGKSGSTNIGHQIGTDIGGNLYTAAELSDAFGKTQGAYRYNLTGYSPATPCCQATRDMSHTGGSSEGGADVPF
jgi:hypothetical protein